MASSVELLTAYVSIEIDGSRIGPEVRKQLAPIGRQADTVGRDAGRRFTRSFGAGARRGAAVITAVTAAATAGFVKSAITAEATFSQTMNTVQAATGVAGDEMQRLSELALDMGAKTSFSANEAADAMLELAKGGLSSATIQAGALEGTLTLAAAGGTDMATAATIASNAMNAFSLSGADMNSVAAALAGGANASSASVESLGEALSQVGPGAVNSGLSLQQTVAALAAFDSAGIKGSDAGTSLKTMLARLVPQTTKAKDAMKALGLDFVKSNGEFESITNIAGQLQDRLGGLSEAQRATALNTIFGSDASRAAAVLMKEGASGIRDYIKATQDQGAAEEMAAARMKGTAGAIENFKGAVETAQIELGLLIQPYVTKGLGVLTRAVNKAVPALRDAVSWAGSFREEFGAIAGQIADSAETRLATVRDVLADIGAAVRDDVLPPLVDLVETYGPLLDDVFAGSLQVASDVLIDGLIPALGTTLDFLARWQSVVVPVAAGVLAMVAAFKAYRAITIAVTAVQAALNIVLAANPIGLVVLALVGLAAGLVVAYKRSETFRKIVDGAFGKVKDVIVGAVDFVVGFVRDNWKLLPLLLLGPIGLAAIAVIKKWDTITGGAKSMVTGTKRVLGNLVDYVTGLPQRILDALGDLAGRLYDAGVEAMRMLGQGIKDKLDVVLDPVRDVAGKISGLFPGSPVKEGPLRSFNGGHAGQELMRLLARGITSGINVPTTAAQRAARSVEAQLTAGIASALAGGPDGLDKYLDRITSGIDKGLDRRLAAIAAQLKRKDISKEVAKAAEQAAAAQAKSLTRMVRQTARDLRKIAREYDAAKAKLKEMTDLRSSVASSISGELDLGSLVQTSEANAFGFGGGQKSVTFEAVAGAVAGLAARAKTFAGKLRALIRAGIPRGLVQEVAGLGSEQGIAVASAILSGTKTQRDQLSADYSTLQTNANAVGDVVVKAMYGKSIAAQEKLIAGLLRRPAIKKAAQQFGNIFTAELLASFGIKVKTAKPKSSTAARTISGNAVGRTVAVPRVSAADTHAAGSKGKAIDPDVLAAIEAIASRPQHNILKFNGRQIGTWWVLGRRAARDLD